MEVSKRLHFIVITSIFFGLILNIIEIFLFNQFAKPPIVLMILIYWTLAYPNVVSLGYAFIVGIIMDIIQFMPLGHSALSFSLTIFLTIKFHPQIRLHSYINKMISILFLLVPYFIISTWLINFYGMSLNLNNIVFSLIASIILWPIIFVCLRFLRIKYVN